MDKKEVSGKIDAQWHRFLTWFHGAMKPAMLNFIMDNKDLAMDIVLGVATEFAGHPKELKFKTAADRLGKAALERAPDVKFRSSWISLLIELALTALKASGQIK